MYQIPSCFAASKKFFSFSFLCLRGTGCIMVIVGFLLGLAPFVIAVSEAPQKRMRWKIKKVVLTGY